MSEFFSDSRKTVTDFLQNVIIIDDEAFFNMPSDTSQEKEEPPITSSFTEPLRRSSTAKQTTLKAPEQSAKNTHSLDAKQLTDCFAKEGLLCSIMRPSESDNIVQQASKVLKKADVIILDWHLKETNEDSEKTVKALIKEALHNEESLQKAMRYIAIYTGEEDLEGKLQIIVDDLVSMGLVPTRHDTYRAQFEHLQINIYAKKLENRLDTKEIQKDEEALVNQIIDDFTYLVHGLVPNMALQSLAEIRKNMHRVLSVFSKELDESYLSHRIMLPEPSDAESLMLDILISELHAIVEDSSVTEPLKVHNIMKWIEKEFDDDRLLRLFFNNEIIDHQQTGKHKAIRKKFDIEKDFQLKVAANFTAASHGIVRYRRELLNDTLQQVFSKGYTEAINCELIKQKKIDPKKFASYLFRDDLHADDIENKFAMMTIIKNKYSKPLPHLSLGSILKRNNNYYLCIIPRCDAARIKNNEQGFPFLRLNLVGTDQAFDIVLKDSGQYKKFKVDYKPHNIYVQSFRKPIQDFNLENKPLYADQVNGQYVFATHSDDCYLWVSELKKEKAQSISNHFSAQLSRVGFNESEYLRRSYKNDTD